MPDVAKQIQETRANWAARKAADEEIRRQNVDETRRFVITRLEKRVPAWALEYVSETRSGNAIDNGASALLSLPGCAPMVIGVYGNGEISQIAVREPVRVEYRDGIGWTVITANQTIYERGGFDEAVDLAASFGEAWSTMQAEVDRRNAEGLEPPPPPVTAWESARRAMTEAHNSYDSASLDPITIQYAIAAGILAIVEQLNLLNDTLMKMDR